MKPGSLYDRIFGFLGQLIALNLLWIVCSLPVITAGASTTALYYCTLKLHKDGDIRVFHDFFKSFKQNFKQSTLIWILMAAVAVFLYMEKEIEISKDAASSVENEKERLLEGREKTKVQLLEIREKTAKILAKIECDDLNKLKKILKKDKNYYVRRYLL